MDSKLSQFSQIMEENGPTEEKMKLLKESNFAELSSVLMESSRNSKLITGVRIIRKEEPVEHIDQNSIKLYRGPVQQKRQFPTRQGSL